MTHPIFARPSWSNARTNSRSRDVPMLATAGLDALATWIARRRQRLAVGDLADRNDYLLQDIGVSLGDALREAAKPFWKR